MKRTKEEDEIRLRDFSARLLNVVAEDQLKVDAANILEQLLNEFVEEMDHLESTGDQNRDIENAIVLLNEKEHVWKQVCLKLVAEQSTSLVSPESFRSHIQTKMPDLYGVWLRVNSVLSQRNSQNAAGV